MDRAESQAEKSREKMPEMKRKKRSDLFNQKQYQKDDLGVTEYRGKSKKSRKSSDVALKDLSLTEITNMKPNM